jgi:hypothetical protein
VWNVDCTKEGVPLELLLGEYDIGPGEYRNHLEQIMVAVRARFIATTRGAHITHKISAHGLVTSSFPKEDPLPEKPFQLLHKVLEEKKEADMQ